jgi:hypothetical protein
VTDLIFAHHRGSGSDAALTQPGQMTPSAMSVVLVLEAPRLSVQRGSAIGPCEPRLDITENGPSSVGPET